MKKLLFLLILFTLTLPGCNPFEPNADLATASPTDPQASASPFPTYTKPAPAPTLSTIELASSVFADLTIETQRLLSPDGRCTWDRLIASSIKESAIQKYDNQFYMRVSVSCVLGEENKEVNWLPVDGWAGQGLGYSIPALLGWSADGMRMYFYDQIIADGCQPIGGWQENFRQLDLETGNVTLLLREMRSGTSLSADTTRLVYYDMQNKDVGIYNLVSGEVQHLALAVPEQSMNWAVGEFTWSPDGQSVLFVMLVGDACNPSGASIQKLDLARGVIQVKWFSTERTASIVEWVDPTRVVITIGKEQHLLDPISGNLD